MEYKINIDKTGFLFNPFRDEIEFEMSQGLYEHLTADEISLFMSDSLTHEYMHKVLCDKYGVTVTKLFDTVQQHFRDTVLHEKIIRLNNIYASSIRITHHKYIERYGIDSFLERACITPDDIMNAKIRCKG